MGQLCVNQYHQGVELSRGDTSTPLCIAHWAHTQEQVFIAVVLWAALLLLAVAWTYASRRQRRNLRIDEIGFSLKYRRWARTSRAAALLNRPVQLATSLGIFGFMISRCNSYEVSLVGYVCMSALYTVALVDAGVRFLASRYKVTHCFAPMTILECLMVAAHCQVGFGSTKLIGGVATRSWLDFSIMRPIFILRSYLEMEKHVPRSSRGWMIVRLAVKVLLLIMFGAATMFFLETLGEMPFFQPNGFAHLYTCDATGVVTRNQTECATPTETWSIMFSFYFTVVTLGTVGYGDNSPKTVLSRLLAIMFIVMGVILFSMEIENLINLYKSRQIGNPPFKSKPDARHVIVMGNPSFSQLSSILRELFHEDHVTASDHQQPETGRLHAVVLGERKSKFTRALVAKLEADPIFAANVTYVAGTATKAEDLERARAKEAEAVFVFPDKLSEDPANEDATNIMRVLATKRYCGPNVRCLVMVLRAENARHMLAAGVSRDDVICENVIKMGTLAQSAVSNGAATLLANLAASLSVDRSLEEIPRRDHLQPVAFVKDAFKDKIIQSDLRLSHVLEDPSVASRKRHWLKEYYQGAAKEMYLIRISKKYGGLTFAEAAGRIFTETGGNVVLIAVEVVFSNTKDELGTPRASDSRVLLNPGNSLIMAEWMQCYVVADDLAHVFTHCICPDEVTREELLLHGGLGMTATHLGGVADTFIEPSVAGEDDDNDVDSDVGEDHHGEVFHHVTAYASMATPTSTACQQNSDHSTHVTTHSELTELRQRRAMPMVGQGTESVVLDRSLRQVALNFAVDGGDPMGLALQNQLPQHNDSSIHVAQNYYQYTDARRMSNSMTSLDGGAPQSLEPPPLDVLLNPRHIVVCSFLGEESLASLQWLLLPLRGVYANGGHPPITILDAAVPTPAVASSLASFNDVYYVCGSPLVYADLQRAGAKAASAVIVLGKRMKDGLLKHASDDVETSIIDSQAIFCTMLIELKMDFAKIFTITELSDESNSKFLGTSFQLRHWETTHGGGGDLHGHNKQPDDDDDSGSSALSWWEYLLLNDIPQQKSEKAIFGLPLYMSGRLLHPELCENMLVQTFYNPSIHKIIRQLVGGPRCTGVIRSFAVPRRFKTGATYGDLFQAFAASNYAGICLGLYRQSTQSLRSGKECVELPIVLATPEPDFEIVRSDRVFVLIGVHTLARAAQCIQRFYKSIRTRQDPAGLAETLPHDGVSSSSSAAADRRGSSTSQSSRKPSFFDPRSRIAKYLSPQQSSAFEIVNVPKTQRRSLIAQESNSSFRSYYV